MKKNVFSKALALCLALVLCLGMMVGCGGKKLTAKELFDLSVNNQEKQFNDGVITFYGNSLDTVVSEEGTTMGVKISFGDAAKQILASSLGGAVSLDWLKEIGFTIGGKLDKGVSSNQIGISLNGTELATINAILDSVSEKLYLGIPDILSDSLSVNIKEMMEEAVGYLPVDLKSALDLKSWLPDQAALKSLVSKYTKVFLENIKEVTKEDATVEAGGLSQKCSKLLVAINADTMKNILKAFADTMEKDTELSGVLDQIGKIMGFTGSEVLPQIVENLRNTDNLKGDLSLVLYTDDKGNVAGLEATGSNPDMENNMTLKISAPVQDGKTALNMEVSNGEQKFTVTGSGTKNGNAAEGSYVIAVDGAEILTVDAKDSDVTKSAKGIFNGSYTIKAGKALSEMVDSVGMDASAVASILTQFSIKADVAMADAKNSKATISLVDNSGNNFVSIDLDAKNGWSGKADIATDKALDMTDTSAMSGLISKLNLSGLVEKLNSAGVPSELTQSLAMLPYFFGASN